MKKELLKSSWLFVLGLLFNFAESLWFGRHTARGFNLKPETIPEFICNILSSVAIALGMLLMAWAMIQCYFEHQKLLLLRKAEYYDDLLLKIDKAQREGLKDE